MLGDLILDRYVWGDAERISQEAPVILLRADQREERLGGSASVASMLATLGANVRLAGVVGADSAAMETRRLLDAFSINHDLVMTDQSRPTTVKERYLGRAQQRHPQQMIRVDYEVRDQISEELTEAFLHSIQSKLDDIDIVLVSDYNKGVCAPTLLRRLISACRKRKIRVIVDPIRGGNYGELYHGCSSMTPNRLEASLATGITIRDIPTAYAAAKKLRQQLDMEVGMVTLDRDGMVLVTRDDRCEHFKVRQRDVYDITGAGDMVLSVLGLVLAAGFHYPEAIRLANTAGGLEVEQNGVVTITREEIIHDISRANGGSADKFISLPQLVREVEQLRQQGQRIVFTNGCFDILHAGHVNYLSEARQQGDVLIVGLNSDSSVRGLGKGDDRPINDENSRGVVLGALSAVDFVCLFEEATPMVLIEALRPDVLVKGADYRLDQVVGRDFVESYGGHVHLAELIPGKSTTATLAKIQHREAA